MGCCFADMAEDIAKQKKPNRLETYDYKSIAIEHSQSLPIDQSKFITMQQTDIKKRYQFKRCMGEGAHGKVFKGKDLESKESVAIKVINKNTITRD